uniref:Uncharacterized protein n=1 Tax=Caenorhabditis japonica TaxID=281687 RepID=A0A8R1EEW1_CAEJA
INIIVIVVAPSSLTSSSRPF